MRRAIRVFQLSGRPKGEGSLPSEVSIDSIQLLNSIESREGKKLLRLLLRLRLPRLLPARDLLPTEITGTDD